MHLVLQDSPKTHSVEDLNGKIGGALVPPGAK